MVARYVPAQYRAKAFNVRYFLGFTVSGLAAPAIAILHREGGFALVLGVASAHGLLVFASACTFWLMAQPKVLARSSHDVRPDEHFSGDRGHVGSRVFRSERHRFRPSGGRSSALFLRD
jgi:hypothetical protein